jgi:hypothetical protein
MICFAKPGLTEDLYIVQKEEFSMQTLDERPSLLRRGKPIRSSERMFQKDYDRKGSSAKKNLLWL